MVIRRETLRLAIGAFVVLVVAAVLMLMLASMTSETKEISPTEALMAETSFTESTTVAQSGGEATENQATEKQADERQDRVEACREDVKEIGEAVEDANEQGKAATTVAQLHDEGVLEEMPELAPVLLYSLEVDQGRPTGVVLVNGVPGPLACDS